MVKLIIRDDDCNYFTRPEDLNYVYRSIPDFPISFAVVPDVTDVAGGCPETHGNTIPHYVGDNIQLIEYLKGKLHSGKCDVVLHGICHGYLYKSSGEKIPEMIWRDEDPLLSETIGKWKSTFEELFDYPIKCFVAPSNQIMKNGIRAVYSNGMNFSGIIPLSFKRNLSIKSLYNYVYRWGVRTVNGFPYPGILDYGTHLELNATNRISFAFLKKMYGYCSKHNLPLSINVHYWHIRDNEELYKGFFDFIKYALSDGAVPTKLSDSFQK